MTFDTKKDLEMVCLDTLAYLLDDKDYHINIAELNVSENGKDFHLFKIILQCDKIKNSYKNNKNIFLKNSGASWVDIKDYYIPLVELLKKDIKSISSKTKSIEIYYKYHKTDSTVSTILCKKINITDLDDLVLDDIWYINLYLISN